MSRWLRTQVGDRLRRSHGVTVVLDPHRIAGTADVKSLAEDASFYSADGWAELRLLWDHTIRRSCGSADRVVVLVRDPQTTSGRDLPYDIERDASSVLAINWPVPPDLREAFRGGGPFADSLVAAAERSTDPALIVADALRMRLGDEGSELQGVLRLAGAGRSHSDVWAVLSHALRTPLAAAVAHDGGDLRAIQDAWSAWLAGNVGHAAALSENAAQLISLHSAGQLVPAPLRATGLPAWVRVGATNVSADELVLELLANEPNPPETLPDWCETAAWWGRVRATIASAPVAPTSATEAWQRWDALDEQFATWLRTSYGSALLSSAEPPTALHRIPSYLARQVQEGGKVLLIVLDGLGFAQWHRIRNETSLTVKQVTGCLAMLPTITVVSRQAIFAGTLPQEFADTIGTTRTEPAHWLAFWHAEGLSEHEIRYEHLHKNQALTTKDLQLCGRAVAVVINAIDDILHGAETLGDRQVDRSVQLWAQTDELEYLVAAGTAAGYSIWITSDHGNLPTMKGQIPRESRALASNGERVRIYANEVLRDAAREHGIAWDPPGFPSHVGKPLFARGRVGYHTTQSQVTHGGLSIDEVIVPLVQVTA